MKRNSIISKADSPAALAEFWDKHDLSDFWDKTKPVRFDVSIETEETLFTVGKKLGESINRVARRRGVSPHDLVNLWLKEKLQEFKAA